MRKFILISLSIVFSSILQSQTISKAPIMVGDLKIDELKSGRISFFYQNPEYKSIIDLVGFIMKDKKQAIFLMDEAIRILQMEETDKSQHIRHSVGNAELVRYGFRQDAIYISDREHRGYPLLEYNCLNIKEALESYEYSAEVNKSEEVE